MRNVALVASVVLVAGTRNTNADLDLAHGLLAWWDLDSRPAGRPAEFPDLSGHQRHSRRLASNSLAVHVDEGIVNVMVSPLTARNYPARSIPGLTCVVTSRPDGAFHRKTPH